MTITATHESGSTISIKRTKAEAPRTIDLLKQSGYVAIVTGGMTIYKVAQ